MRLLWSIAAAVMWCGSSCVEPAVAGGAAAGSGDGPAAPAKSAAASPVVSESADRTLKEAAAFIGSAPKFSFTADVVFEHVLPSGQKVQFSAKEDVALERPGKLYLEWNSDLGSRRFWYDGSTVTLYDPSTPFYASEDAPPEIDSMLDLLIEQLGFSPPLTNLFHADPYGKVRAGIQYGVDLGGSQINGRKCRSLAFVEKEIDWQVWVAADPQPVLCKLTLSYKTQPSQPQFSAVFSNWDFAPRFGERAFTASLPPGLEKIPFDRITRDSDGTTGDVRK